MSVFRNNPRPTENVDVPGRFGETPARADTNNDLLARGQQPEEERAAYPSFAERESRPMPTDADKCPNVIAAGSKWSGSLNIDDSVRIEGQVSGEVVAKGTVHIGEGARVEAKIRAAFVVVAGSFKGEVRCDERLELTPKGRVEGDIVTKSLTISEGATIDGSIQMTAPKDRARNGDEAEPAPIREARNAKALSN